MADDVDSIRQRFETDGYVIVKLLSDEKCDDLIVEQWEKVLLPQPRLPEFALRVYDSNNHELTPGTNRELFLRTVKGPFTKPQLKYYKERWCLHRGFGACCDPSVFHLPGVWAVRQDPRLYAIARALCGRQDLWVDINRSIQKLPGEGLPEFLHWDINPFDEDQQISDSVCGKLCYTPSQFVCVPGTHSTTFLKRFRSEYKDHYTVSKSQVKFAIDSDKPDPLQLVSKRKVVDVPAGCIVLWSPALLHGQEPSSIDAQVEYGCYIGYFPAVPRQQYESKCGITEVEDRLRSYYRGIAPQLWPSLDEIHFYPKRFRNFPNQLLSHIRKMPQSHPSITTRITKDGKMVPHIEPWKDPTYRPPPLSPLGEKLLGTKLWRFTCCYNQHASRRPISSPEDFPILLVTKMQHGHGLRGDMAAYEQELHRRRFDVRKMELGWKLSKRALREEKTALSRALETVRCIIGFEFLGDKHCWDLISRKLDLLVIFVPNLEYTKMSNESTSVTMRNLCRIDLIIAKESDIFQRIQSLRLRTAGQRPRFSRKKGNLMLVPHTTWIGNIPRSPQQSGRHFIIHFAGFSKNKNTKENVEAGFRLLHSHPHMFHGIIVKTQLCAKSDHLRSRCHCPYCSITKLQKQHPSLHMEIITTNISEDEKAGLYSRCRLALCASEMEGFGHYIVEAAAFGCQVVTTDGMPMRSILRYQVSLAAPEKSEDCNFGIRYKVKSEAIYNAATRLIGELYQPHLCVQNVQDRMDSFQDHMGHLTNCMIGGAMNELLCIDDGHRKYHGALERCNKCNQHKCASLVMTNYQLADKVVWLCSCS